ncbi:MAG: GNAT family N-acetyltransferase [Rubrivivax sp.]
MPIPEELTRHRLRRTDADDALRLSDAAGWNQGVEDWRLFIENGQVLGYRSADGTLVASGAALPYPGADTAHAGLGWISMVLVSTAWRQRGLATSLLHESIDWLRQRRLTPVLDATPAGQVVYTPLGFQPGLAFERWQATLEPSAIALTPSTAVRARSEDRSAIVALDDAAQQVQRAVLIDALLARPHTQAWIDAPRTGFVIRRAGHRALQIGPLVATDEDAAVALLGNALAGIDGAVFLDVPVRWSALAQRLTQWGFVRQRPFVRMALGPTAALHGSDRQFVLAGPEFG